MARKILRWAAYRRNQEAVAAAIARKEYEDLTPTAVGVMDEFFALMAEVGILARLAVDGCYQRRMVPLVLLVTTYCAKIIQGLSSINQLPTHLFRDAGLLRLIGFTAKQVGEGFSRRGKGLMRPIHKNTVADALERLSEEESEEIYGGSVRDLVKAGFVKETVFSMDGTELHTTARYQGAGSVTSSHEVTDRRGRTRKVTSTRHGYLLLSLRGVLSNIVVAAKVAPIGRGEHPYVIELVRAAVAAGVKVSLLLIDGAYCVGQLLWRLKHEEGVDFIVPGDTTMSITEDARGLALLKDAGVVEEDRMTTAVGLRGLTSYDAYRPQESKGRRGPRASLNAVVITRWKGQEVPQEEQMVLITSRPVDHPLQIVELYRKRAEMENKLHRELKQGWYIENFPSKKHLACLAHIYLTLTLYNVACAYKTERGQELANRGIRRLRAEHLAGAAWVLVVYTREEYGIFDVEEFALLSGNPPKRFHRYKS